jgi:hypothetical protein
VALNGQASWDRLLTVPEICSGLFVPPRKWVNGISFMCCSTSSVWNYLLHECPENMLGRCCASNFYALEASDHELQSISDAFTRTTSTTHHPISVCKYTEKANKEWHRHAAASSYRNPTDSSVRRKTQVHSRQEDQRMQTKICHKTDFNSLILQKKWLLYT